MVLVPRKVGAASCLLAAALQASCAEWFHSDACQPGDISCNGLALISYLNCPYTSQPFLIDTFQYNGTSTEPQDLLAFDRTLLVLMTGASGTRWIVRASFDAGATWEITDDYIYPGGADAKGRGLTLGADGAVYASGTGLDASSNQHWVVRRSGDGGRTWSTVDDFSAPGATYAPAPGGGVARNGLRILGSISTPAAFAVRSSVDGFAWQTLYQETLSVTPLPNQPAVAPDGALYVPGARDSMGTDIDTILKSVDNGASWTIKNQYLPAGHLSSGSLRMVAEADQQLVIGYSAPAPGLYASYLRRSRDGGESWELAHEFKNDTANLLFQIFRAPNSGRDLFAAGTEGAQLLVSHRAVIYRSRDDGVTWSKFSDESLLGAPASIIGFMRAGPGGALYMLGNASNGGVDTTVIQVAPCF